MTERKDTHYAPPDSRIWKQRYAILKSDGFVHEEAARLATGTISSPDMVKGRTKRKRWYLSALSIGLTAGEIEERIDEMYDTQDWMDPWTQFYPEQDFEYTDEKV